jgi:hypothetical protein
MGKSMEKVLHMSLLLGLGELQQRKAYEVLMEALSTGSCCPFRHIWWAETR